MVRITFLNKTKPTLLLSAAFLVYQYPCTPPASLSCVVAVKKDFPFLKNTSNLFDSKINAVSGHLGQCCPQHAEFH